MFDLMADVKPPVKFQQFVDRAHVWTDDVI